MGKVFLFWTLAMITAGLFLWGGSALFFWVVKKARESKLTDDE